MKEYFERLTDTRQQAKVLHNFAEIVMMVICAVIAGCDIWEARVSIASRFDNKLAPEGPLLPYPDR